MRRRFSIPLIALFGVTLGFTGVSALSGLVSALNSPACAPEHPKPGDTRPHGALRKLDAFTAMMARDEAAKAQRTKKKVRSLPS
jgi:hypothetical protein